MKDPRFASKLFSLFVDRLATLKQLEASNLESAIVMLSDDAHWLFETKYEQLKRMSTFSRKDQSELNHYGEVCIQATRKLLLSVPQEDRIELLMRLAHA